MSQALVLITTREVAQRAGVDVSTVARWARDGKLTPAYEADGRTGVRLFNAEDVDTFLAARNGAEL